MRWLKTCALLFAFSASLEAAIGTIVTFPDGSNGNVQFNDNRRFGGEPEFTYSTSTKVLSVPGISISTFTVGGQSYIFPASQSGGSFLRTDGVGGLTWESPVSLFTSTGVALGIYDGDVQITSPTIAINFNGTHFILSLQGTTTAFVGLNPSTVTLLGSSIDLGSEVSGSLPAASIAAGNLGASVVASSIAVGSVQDAAIVSVSGSKVTGNIVGNAAGITGTVNFSQVIGGVQGTTVYPASSTASFPFGMTVSTVVASTVTVSGRIVFADGTVITSTSTLGGGSAASPNESIQFNSGGVFGGTAELIWDVSEQTLEIDGNLDVNFGGVPVLEANQFGTTVGTLTVTNLASGKCVETGAGGLFTAAAGACGTGGGSASDLLPGDTDYIQNRSSLQSGSVFHVSSGTVNGEFYVNKFGGDGFRFHARDNTFDPSAYIAYTFPDETHQFRHIIFTPGGGNGAMDIMGPGLPTGCGLGGFKFTTPTSGGSAADTVCITGGYIAGSSVTVTDEAYGAGWNGSVQVPTKNALYDKIETISVGGGGVTVYPATATASFPFGFTVSTFVVTGMSTMTFTSNTGITFEAGSRFTGPSLNFGTNGQVWTSGGPGTTPDWTTVSGGGGGGDNLGSHVATMTLTAPFSIVASSVIADEIEFTSIQARSGISPASLSTGTPLMFDVNRNLVSSSPLSRWDFTTAGLATWTKPNWASQVRFRVCGAGSGGGGGNGQAAGIARAGGAGGGGGACIERTMEADMLPPTITISVGTGGNGGAGGTGAVGADGFIGGNSNIYTLAGSTWIFAGAGGNGNGDLGVAQSGGGGGGSCARGVTGGAGNIFGGCPASVTAQPGAGGAGGGAAITAAGRGAEYGGGGGGFGGGTTAAGTGGSSIFGGSGGGGAGGCTTGNVCGAPAAGGGGGWGLQPSLGGGAANAGTSGASCTLGGNGAAGDYVAGGQGGGGGGSDADSSAAACVGGTGGLCGGGGGGGGAGTNVGAAGGPGGAGCAYIWAW